MTDFRYGAFIVNPIGDNRIDIYFGFKKKTVRVEDSSEFRYKLMKTKIQAAGGAHGLVTWLNNNVDLFEVMIVKLLDYIWYEMKEVK